MAEPFLDVFLPSLAASGAAAAQGLAEGQVAARQLAQPKFLGQFQGMALVQRPTGEIEFAIPGGAAQQYIASQQAASNTALATLGMLAKQYPHMPVDQLLMLTQQMQHPERYAKAESTRALINPQTEAWRALAGQREAAAGKELAHGQLYGAQAGEVPTTEAARRGYIGAGTRLRETKAEQERLTGTARRGMFGARTGLYETQAEMAGLVGQAKADKIIQETEELGLTGQIGRAHV